jgi:N6-L-threonylcarbamoyladenine synthase
MLVLGIETSCDECAVAVVEDGRLIRANVVATQIPFHARWGGVVPEIASRMHTEWIAGTTAAALDEAGVTAADIGAVAATAEPGLLGSLLVGRSFAQGFAWTRGIPFIPVNHLYAHLYAACLSAPGAEGVAADYPFLGLLVSGGHSMVCRVDGPFEVAVLGTTLDDAAGEAFDKVGKHYGLPYPAGKYVEILAREGDEDAFAFPLPNLHKSGRPSDMSYSGLKNAAVNQLDTFRRKAKGAAGDEKADIIASFQKTAVRILLRALFRAVDSTGLTTVVAGGGVAANAYLRAQLAERADIRAVFPPPALCGDNGAMVAGLGYRALERTGGAS